MVLVNLLIAKLYSKYLTLRRFTCSTNKQQNNKVKKTDFLFTKTNTCNYFEEISIVNTGVRINDIFISCKAFEGLD